MAIGIIVLASGGGKRRREDRQGPYWTVSASVAGPVVDVRMPIPHTDVVPGTRTRPLNPLVNPGSVGASCLYQWEWA